jgi:hypothetical protein
VLQLADLGADGLLRQMQPLRRAREVGLLCEGDERSEVSQLDVCGHLSPEPTLPALDISASRKGARHVWRVVSKAPKSVAKSQ